MADHLTVAGRAEATIVNYVRGLRDLQAHYDLPADKLSRDQLIAFLAGRKPHISSSTLNTLICSLKYYYREVLRCQELIVDLPNPRYSKQLGDLLDADEVRTLLRATRSLRHRIVLELIFSLGLRVAEVGRLRLGDFDRTQRTLIIRTSKGNVTRVLPYGERLRGTLIDYFRQEKPVDYLIPGRERSKSIGISVRGVQYLLRMTLQRSGLKKHVCPHALRHSFAVHYLNNGGNILRLQQLLGHAYLSSTLIYLRYTTFTLRDIDSPLDFLYCEPRN
ncbi:tyrosine-type recombinase/integrase [Lewinella cohaerens]|uniref:tyrosine-type recombinase/integrase n=1 Tax=Lewinella cohaerens TaxID=70995 RepID=UPI00037D0C8C|nr:tyrosine-type recombinase/integrase [Lewinella cohaerens]